MTGPNGEPVVGSKYAPDKSRYRNRRRKPNQANSSGEGGGQGDANNSDGANQTETPVVVGGQQDNEDGRPRDAPRRRRRVRNRGPRVNELAAGNENGEAVGDADNNAPVKRERDSQQPRGARNNNVNRGNGNINGGEQQASKPRPPRPPRSNNNGPRQNGDRPARVEDGDNRPARGLRPPRNNENREKFSDRTGENNNYGNNNTSSNGGGNRGGPRPPRRFYPSRRVNEGGNGEQVNNEN